MLKDWVEKNKGTLVTHLGVIIVVIIGVIIGVITGAIIGTIMELL